MNAYEFDLSRADQAKDLHRMAAEINADVELTGDEKNALLEAVSRRFAQLNAAAAGPQKPRWDTAVHVGDDVRSLQ